MIIWKEIESKGVKWLVGSNGSVKCPAHTTTYTRIRKGNQQMFTANFSEKTLSPWVNKSGYYEVAMQVRGKRIKHLLHRLIGMAFVDGYGKELTINHINGNKLDNRIENLEWVSLARNSQHAWDTGLVNLRGEKNPGHKLTSKQVVYIRRLLAKGVSAHALSVISGVSNSAIDLIKQGKRWSHIN